MSPRVRMAQSQENGNEALLLRRVSAEQDLDKKRLITSLTMLVIISYGDSFLEEEEATDLRTLCDDLLRTLSRGDGTQLRAYCWLLDAILQHGKGVRSLHQLKERLGDEADREALQSAQDVLLPQAPPGAEGDACGDEETMEDDRGDKADDEAEEDTDDDEADDEADDFIDDEDDAIKEVRAIGSLVSALDQVVRDINDRAKHLSDIIRRTYTYSSSGRGATACVPPIISVERFLEHLRSRPLIPVDEDASHEESMKASLAALDEEAQAAEERLLLLNGTGGA